jgi:hypothetical protein
MSVFRAAARAPTNGYLVNGRLKKAVIYAAIKRPAAAGLFYFSFWIQLDVAK